MNQNNKYKYQNVDVNQIKMNDLNTKYFHMYEGEGKAASAHGSSFSQLVASIDAVGLRNPIILTQDYRILAGHRRYQAFLKLNQTSIPALIHLDKLTPAQEEFALIDDNIQHRGHDGYKEAELKKRRYELYSIIIPGFISRIASKENPITSKEMSEKTGTSIRKAERDLTVFKIAETKKIKKIIYAKDGIDQADIQSFSTYLGKALVKYGTANVKTRKKMDAYITKFNKDINKL